jgi:5'-methylthioadenosine phosphorylase
MAEMLGVIGGSGLYRIEGMTGTKEVRVKTPFGDPSDAIVTGEIGGRSVAFLPRHGRGHRLSPTEINYRANVWAMKKIGVKWLLSVSAVGSMKEKIRPGDIVVPDQFYDLTKFRANSFFGEGVVGHVQFSDPVCPALANAACAAAKKVVRRVHRGGTYLCMEGPAFSSRGESLVHRSWGVDVIGMTNMPEAKLAREAELCYATLALATDYDCWHESEEAVTVEAIVAVLTRNVENSKKIVSLVASALPPKGGCGCGDALKHAILTDPKAIPAAAKKRLSLLIGRYVS